MLKYIIISLGAILGIFLIYKLFKTPKLYKKWAVFNKARLVILIVAVFTGGLVVLVYQIGSNKDIPKSEILDIIKNIDPKEITCIKLYSYSLDNLKDTLILSDSEIVSQFANGINKFELYQPNTPIPKWEINMLIELKSNSLNNIVFEMIKNKDGIFVIWIYKTSSLGKFKLGVYSSEELGKLVENILNS